MAYQEFSDDFWKKSATLVSALQAEKSGGSPPLDFRLILSGIFHRLEGRLSVARFAAVLGFQKHRPRAFSELGERRRICRYSPLGYRKISRASWDSMEMAGHGRGVGTSAGAGPAGGPGGRGAGAQSDRPGTQSWM